MKEYVFRILTRDPDRPLDERTLIEFGVEDAEAFGKAVGAVGGLLQLHGKPETVALAMRQYVKKVIILGN
jgi:hypothetical protein